MKQNIYVAAVIFGALIALPIAAQWPKATDPSIPREAFMQSVTNIRERGFVQFETTQRKKNGELIPRSEEHTSELQSH